MLMGIAQECVAVFIDYCKRIVEVPCVGSDFHIDWTLYMKLANGIHHRTHIGGNVTGLAS